MNQFTKARTGLSQRPRAAWQEDIYPLQHSLLGGPYSGPSTLSEGVVGACSGSSRSTESSDGERERLELREGLRERPVISAAAGLAAKRKFRPGGSVTTKNHHQGGHGRRGNWRDRHEIVTDCNRSPDCPRLQGNLLRKTAKGRDAAGRSMRRAGPRRRTRASARSRTCSRCSRIQTRATGSSKSK